MHRNVTALYRSHGTVQLLRRDLADFGLSPDVVRVVPDTAFDMNSDPDPARLVALHDLDLPEHDVRDYEDRIRRGDYLVSVTVEPELVPQVEDIMRRPDDFAHMHEHPGAIPEDGAFVDDRDPELVRAGDDLRDPASIANPTRAALRG